MSLIKYHITDLSNVPLNVSSFTHRGLSKIEGLAYTLNYWQEPCSTSVVIPPASKENKRTSSMDSSIGRASAWYLGMVLGFKSRQGR